MHPCLMIGALLIICAFGISGCGQIILSTDDAIVRGDGRATLVANVELTRVKGVRRNLEDVEVSFHVGGRKVGYARTDEDGRAMLDTSIRPDQRVFGVTLKHDGWWHQQPGRIFHWRPDRTIVAVDLDETVSATQYRTLLFADEDDKSIPVEGSAAALTRLAADCQIVYITGRPRFLWEKTQRWLERHGFPPGPVITAPNMTQCILQSSFKRIQLANMRETWPGALIGIGDRGADIHAYGQNGMLTLLVGGTDSVDAKRQMYRFGKWESLGEFCAANQSVLSDPKQLAAALKSGVDFSVKFDASARAPIIPTATHLRAR